ncbi:hypothetical protein D3C78_522680 [compost metagenome]
MSCRPSRLALCARLISTITCLAKIAKLAELPTEVVGTMWPCSVMATASMTAMSGSLSCWLRSCSTVSDRCWSMNMTLPSLMALRRVLSTWNGMRRASTPASVSCLSRSLPRLAPVIRLIFRGDCLARSASAWGTALASPARVKPLMPTVMPSSIRPAASAALITLLCREDKRIRSRYMDCYLGLLKLDAQSSVFAWLRPATKVECEALK